MGQDCTAKQIRFISPRKETARPQSQFLHSCFCERFIYPLDPPIFLQQNRRTHRGNINHSQKHEYRNCWGRPVSFLETFVSNFRNKVFSSCLVIDEVPVFYENVIYLSERILEKRNGGIGESTSTNVYIQMSAVSCLFSVWRPVAKNNRRGERAWGNYNIRWVFLRTATLSLVKAAV